MRWHKLVLSLVEDGFQEIVRYSESRTKEDLQDDPYFDDLVREYLVIQNYIDIALVMSIKNSK